MRPVIDHETPAGVAGFAGLLVETGLLTRTDLVVAEQHARREHLELVDAVVALGLAPELDAYRALGESIGIDLIQIGDQVPSELAVRLVPERVARRHLVAPLAVDNCVLTYATSRPLDADAEREIAYVSGRLPKPVLATRSSLVAAVERCYPKLRVLEVLAARLSTERTRVEEEVLTVSAGATESTVIDLCNSLLGRAIEVGASDMHIDCTDEGAVVRFRICGVLEPVLTLPATASHSIRNRYKIMAGADIAVRLRPQDGAFRLKVNERVIDVRLSSLPAADGERLVMRIIDNQSPLQTLDRLGYDADTVTRLRRSLARPHGLILITGPTGSGKTTALYAALSHLRTGQTSIVSVEDPVERRLPGVTQVPVNAKAGNTFPAILRSLLRQDPNVILVGEVRDREVAQIVGQAARTGHLVLTSLQTVDTATAVTRLMNLGLEPVTIAETLTAVLAQRLVRALCPHCRRRHDDAEALRLGKTHHIGAIPFSAGPGCERCQQTGYLGRVPVAELLTPSEGLRATIARGATAYEIRAAMHADGAATMRDRAIALVAAGITSIQEVDRVLAGESTVRQPRTATRVLITDADPLTRTLLKLLLEREAFGVLEATNGQQAVEIAIQAKLDLLIIDLHMPENDGGQAIGRLRRHMSLAMMPILVLIAEDYPGIEERVLSLGADDYIIKPLDPALLLARVHAFFRRLKPMP